MGKLKHLAAIAVLVSTNALAQQSNLDIYGVVDTMLRYTTNQLEADRKTVGNQFQMGDGGALQGSRLGFKGQESIDNNTLALFKLEMGFLANTGARDQQGQIFGRTAYVGLRDKTWGEVDAGRQYGVAFNTLGNYDPLAMGNMPENEWQLFLMGVRFDNSLKYTNTWGGMRAEVQYALGGQAGGNQIGSTVGLGLTYTEGRFSLGGFEQQSTDKNTNRVNVAGIGANYAMVVTTLYINYFSARRDPGFGKGGNNTGEPLANTSLMSNIVGGVGNTLTRTDNVLTAGIQINPASPFVYTFGYMTDSVKNETSAGNHGKISTAYAMVNYSFSKRTDIYFGADYTHVSDGEIDHGALTNTILQFAGKPLGGQANRTGVAVGLRASF